jgi:hypothetical protein
MHRDPLLRSKEQPPLEKDYFNRKGLLQKKGPPWEKKQKFVGLA